MKPSEAYNKILNGVLAESTLDDDAAIRERKAYIAENPHLLKRLVWLALHQTVHFIGAERVRELYESPYHGRGFEVLGHGANATAFREYGSDAVRKIIRGTDGLSDADRAELAHALEDQITVCEGFLPSVSVPTSVSIGPSPILNRPTVQLLQPFVSFSAEPSDPREIIYFAEKSLEEMMPSGYLPDVMGRRNLINTDGGIRLVDTIPIPVAQDKTFGRCAARLYEMASTGK